MTSSEWPDDGHDLLPGARLLSRVVDRIDSPDDWRSLRTLARDDSELWHELADALQDDALVRAAVAPCLARAEVVEVGVAAGAADADGAAGVPGAAAVVGTAGAAGTADATEGSDTSLGLAGDAARRAARRNGAGRRPWWGALTGWAAALLLASAWLAERGGIDVRVPAAGAPEGRGSERWVAPPRGEDALASLPLAGRALPADGAVPEPLAVLAPVLVGAAPAPDGSGMAVVSLTSVLQQQIVTGAYEVGHDDLGQPRTIPIDLAALLAAEAL